AEGPPAVRAGQRAADAARRRRRSAVARRHGSVGGAGDRVPEQGGMAGGEDRQRGGAGALSVVRRVAGHKPEAQAKVGETPSLRLRFRLVYLAAPKNVYACSKPQAAEEATGSSARSGASRSPGPPPSPLP